MTYTTLDLFVITRLQPLIFMLMKITPHVFFEIICFLLEGAIVLFFFITFVIILINRRNKKAVVFQQKQRRGICWDKIFWVFLVSAFIGDVIETIFCYVVGEGWMSRSSVLYGPFSIVWGLGAVILTLVLSGFSHKADRYIFLVGALLGGLYEYVCSVFTELFLGTTFWDYSWMPLNIGGRTNVLYMCFWGLLSVVWIKFIYPKMSGILEKMPVFPGKIMTRILVLFMVCNTILSTLAMVRYTQRKEGKEAENVVEAFLDEHYEDARMEKVWPNMMINH